MQQNITVWPWHAKALACMFLVITEWVVFEDVLSHGAPVTTKHLMTQTVLLGTVYFGHVLGDQVRQRRVLSSLGCVVLVVLGTGVSWSISMSRNGEVEEAKSNVARAHNADRDRLAGDLKVADAARGEAHTRYLDAVEAQSIASKAKAAACKNGPGYTVCVLASRELDKADARVNAAEAADAKARDAYWDVYGRFSGKSTAKVEDASTKYLVTLLVALPWVSGTPEQIEARVRMLNSGTLTLFSEFGFFLACAIRTPRSQSHFYRFVGFIRSRRSRRIDAEATEVKAPLALPPANSVGLSVGVTELNGAKRQIGRRRALPSGKMGKQEAEAYVFSQLDLGQAFYGQDDLALACGVSESTMHDWLKDWTQRGLVIKSKIGKRNAIVAPAVV